MNNKVKKTIKCIVTMGILLTLSFIINMTHAQSEETIDSVWIKNTSGTNGTKLEMTKLERKDGFSKAIFIEGPQDIPIIIGFRQCEVGEYNAILISIDGCEKIIRTPMNSSCIIMNDDHDDDDDDDHDIPFTLCALEAVIDMLINISECGENEDDDEHEDHDEHENVNSCILKSILTMLIDIIECI